MMLFRWPGESSLNGVEIAPHPGLLPGGGEARGKEMSEGNSPKFVVRYQIKGKGGGR